MGCKLVTTTMLGIYVNLVIRKKKQPTNKQSCDTT